MIPSAPRRLKRVRGPRRFLCQLPADAGSAGGTFVNDVRVLEPVPLRSGDPIGVGNARLRFRERQKRAS